jgi:hypothetical protein
MDADKFHAQVLAPLAEILEFTPEVDVVDADSITLETTEVTFDVMEKLSIAFGTKSINVRTRREALSGCSTCNFYYEVGTITVENITRWPGVS